MSIAAKPDIKNYSQAELEHILKTDLHVPAYHAKQIHQWLYQKYVSSFDQMSNLSAALRAQLAERFSIKRLECAELQMSQDGTRKYLFRLDDGEKIETAWIPTDSRATLCVSTQVGCAMACRFCSSGLDGLKRNLTCAEIVNQLLGVLTSEGTPKITHIVFMGIGEPLQNMAALLKAIDIINAPSGFYIGARRITISTSGLVKGIEQLAQYGKQVELAISLHAPNDTKRLMLMPINKKYPIATLIQTCKDYIKATGRQVTFEYVMLKDVNDTPQDAHELGKLLKGMLAKVNLIPYNPMPEDRFQCSPMSAIKNFQNILQGHRVVATIRTPRGRDIAAACGQLRRDSKE